MRFGVALLAFAGGFSLAPVGEARITQLQVVRTESPTFGGTSFGSVGQYEKIVYRATGAVDPSLPGNALITDILGAPRNAQGLVEYSMDVMVVKPIDPSKGSGKIFYDVVNRGSDMSFNTFQQASAHSASRWRIGSSRASLRRRADTRVLTTELSSIRCRSRSSGSRRFPV
jgi:hypothetical protein